MAFDITKKRAVDTATIDLVEGDGSPMLDDEGNKLSVTVYGPGSRQWQQADAERSRRRAMKMQKAGKNKIAAALDNSIDDEVDFLTTITISFNGWDYPAPEGEGDKSGNWKSDKDMMRAAYSDEALGYIRDHVHKEVHDWSGFTKGSATS